MSQLLNRINDNVLTPGLAMLPSRMDTPEARCELLAIGLQESKLIHRWQVVDLNKPNLMGPARGLWQFERGGGVTGVLTHPSTKKIALALCDRRSVPPVARYVWTKLAEDDLLACAFARLLLWADPRPLPALGKGAEGWDCYVRNWRPGKPHRSTWNGYYAQALEQVRGQ